MNNCEYPARILQVRVANMPGKKLDHQGIKVQLLGQIELKSERGSPHDFVSLGALILPVPFFGPHCVMCTWDPHPHSRAQYSRAHLHGTMTKIHLKITITYYIFGTSVLVLAHSPVSCRATCSLMK